MGERLPFAAPGPFTVLSAELEVRAPLAGLGYPEWWECDALCLPKLLRKTGDSESVSALV